MKKLEEKLNREAKSEAQVISHVFQLPHWQQVRYSSKERVYIYQKEP